MIKLSPLNVTKTYLLNVYSLVVWFNMSQILNISLSSSYRSWRVRKEHHRETDEDPACQWLQCRVSIVNIGRRTHELQNMFL